MSDFKEENVSSFKHLIGIISDTHDNLDAIDEAIGIFNSKKVSLVIHAGDYIAPFSAAKFEKLDAPMVGVFGNNDGEKVGLRKKFLEIDVSLEDLLQLTHDDKKIAVYHGTIKPVVDALVKSREYDVVVSGHSHEASVRFEGGILVINPGEACGYLSGKRTLCILDYEKMEAEIVEF